MQEQLVQEVQQDLKEIEAQRAQREEQGRKGKEEDEDLQELLDREELKAQLAYRDQLARQAQQVPRVRLTGLSVARFPLTEFDAGITNFDNLLLGVDLILGLNAFDGYRLQFDFAVGRLYLFSS